MKASLHTRKLVHDYPMVSPADALPCDLVTSIECGEYYADVTTPPCVSLEEHRALVNKFATAPDLLVVAKRILELVEGGDWKLPKGFHETELGWLRTAIAKAEGKTVE